MELQNAATTMIMMLMLLEVPAMYVKEGPHHRSRELEFESLLLRPQAPTKRLCGSELMEVLFMVCKGNPKRKKSMPDELEGDQWGMLGETSTFPFRSRRLSRTLLPRRIRRDTSGIVDECCNKPCTRDEMVGYCQRSSEEDEEDPIMTG